MQSRCDPRLSHTRILSMPFTPQLDFLPPFLFRPFIFEQSKVVCVQKLVTEEETLAQISLIGDAKLE